MELVNGLPPAEVYSTYRGLEGGRPSSIASTLMLKRSGNASPSDIDAEALRYLCWQPAGHDLCHFPSST